MAAKEGMLDFGPCAIPNVPVADFTKYRISHEQQKMIWRIIGPSIQRNINKLPLWQVLMMCYVEGLNHGAGLEAEQEHRKHEKEQSEDGNEYDG